MKLTLLTVGKTDIKWVKEGLDMYAGRLSHYIPFSVIEIPELKNVRPQDEVILLDERGVQRSSLAFASWLEEKLSRGGKDIVFVIGGAYGFSQKVYDRAGGRISLSQMTFSHQIVRTIFAEQLYRAFTIMRWEPYHQE